MGCYTGVSGNQKINIQVLQTGPQNSMSEMNGVVCKILERFIDGLIWRVFALRHTKNFGGHYGLKIKMSSITEKTGYVRVVLF